MLQLIKSIQELKFSQIMDVYTQSNLRYGNKVYKQLPEGLRLLSAEQDFYAYLCAFFRTQGAFYAVWCVDGQYLSALRMEPYHDGYLLAGLETIPDERGKGYAKLLIKQTLVEFRTHSRLPVYSHIEKSNSASIAVHKACGFVFLWDEADYIDGTHADDASTWIWK
ncbi:MAG: GNAT family N-acetyltransferase [Oscillospiraceae bacterium]|nr:GNAT family N-acetyltransferase [Oscillospiraceae bacterium]